MKHEMRWVNIRLTITGLISEGGQLAYTAGLLVQAEPPGAEPTSDCGDDAGLKENRHPAPPLAIPNNTVPTVDSFRFLGSTISQGRACMYVYSHTCTHARTRARTPSLRGDTEHHSSDQQHTAGRAEELTHIITELHIGLATAAPLL